MWNNSIIAKWNGEQKPVLAMRPYIDEVYSIDNVNAILMRFDMRGFAFRNLITFKQFQNDLELLKPRK